MARVKHVLGVNRYICNIAVRFQCSRDPIILFCISMIYKYFIRIRDISSNRILQIAFMTDQELFKDKSKSWFSNFAAINKLLNVGNKKPVFFLYNCFVQLLKDSYLKKTEWRLSEIRNDVTDSKLWLFSNILDIKKLPNYQKVNSNSL